MANLLAENDLGLMRRLKFLVNPGEFEQFLSDLSEREQKLREGEAKITQRKAELEEEEEKLAADQQKLREDQEALRTSEGTLYVQRKQMEKREENWAGATETINIVEKPLEAKDKVAIEARKKEFMQMILQKMEELKPMLDSLQKAEKITGVNQKVPQNRLIKNFQAEMLGILSLYVDRDDITLAPEAAEAYREATDKRIIEFLDENPGQKDRLREVILRTMIQIHPNIALSQECYEGCISSLVEFYKRADAYGRTEVYSPKKLLQQTCINSNIRSLALRGEKKGGEYAPAMFETYDEGMKEAMEAISGKTDIGRR